MIASAEGPVISTCQVVNAPFGWLHWNGRCVRPETKRKRIDQMLAELKAGGVYMGMAHRPSRRPD